MRSLELTPVIDCCLGYGLGEQPDEQLDRLCPPRYVKVLIRAVGATAGGAEAEQQGR
jgi:hypothetical protein